MKRLILFALAGSISLGAVLAAAEEPRGTLTGRLLMKGGKPMAGGTVFLFAAEAGPPPAPERYWRVPDEVMTLDSAGRFTMELVPGSYHVGGVKREKEQEIGPPRAGDHFLTSRDEKGEPRPFTVRGGETTDIGSLGEAVPFDPALTRKREGTTGIEGTILDAAGKPVAGALVFAYPNPDMSGKPLFVSDRTGADGRYLLRVSEGGRYFLKVRDVYGGGPPVQGAVMGAYGDGNPLPLAVKTGVVTPGGDIRVIRFTRHGRKAGPDPVDPPGTE
ncbi:hypothetical protein GEOBC_01544 [Geobacteraceae bacterium]|nr:hypothetical protein GEOBC_01544 [Geobacteraceae bacterium]